MGATAILDRLGRHIRLVTLLVVAALVGALMASGGIGGIGTRQHSTPHYLGLKGLELAAFEGKATLYLRMAPVTPTTPGPGHSTDVPLTSIGWYVAQAPSSASAGAGSGKLVIQDFSINKLLDKFTPAFLNAAATNSVSKTATIYVTTSAKPNEELVYTLTNPTVAGDHEAATTTGSTESITLACLKIRVQYEQAGKVVSIGTIGGG